MQICGAGPYDQHIMLGEHELTDHSQSLAALGIFPGALLTLKVRLDSSFISSCCVRDHANMKETRDVRGGDVLIVDYNDTFVPPEQRTETNRRNLDLRSGHCISLKFETMDK